MMMMMMKGDRNDEGSITAVSHKSRVVKTACFFITDNLGKKRLTG